MTDQIVVPAKFRGPPNSGNGGYVAGVFANVLAHFDIAVQNTAIEVTLRAPIPLDTPMRPHFSNQMVTIHHGNALIAEAKTADLDLVVPAPATWAEAIAVQSQSYSLPLGLNSLFDKPMRGVHPICFCCGAELSAEDGLHVYSASVQGGEQVAAAWVANKCFADEHGFIKSEFIWTALDCPGQMAWRARGIQTGMLGRLTAKLIQPVRAETRTVIIGWTIANEGKKYFAGTALFNEDNELCAYAKAVWIGRFN